MKHYKVTLLLITGYEDNDLDKPITKQVEHTVKANNPTHAIMLAKQADKSSYSIYESYVDEA